MSLQLIDYLFLSCFSTGEYRKMKSVYHILKGKRTVSIMIQAYIWGLGGYFSYFDKLNLEAYEKKMNRFIAGGLLAQEDQGFRLSAAGIALLDKYPQWHSERPMPSFFRYHMIYHTFRKRLLFLLQIYSEAQHENKRYQVVEKDVTEQKKVKRFLKQMDSLYSAETFAREIYTLFQQGVIQNPDIFACQFEGFETVRRTARQTAKVFSIEETEVMIYWKNDWYRIMEQVEEQKQQYPFLALLMKTITAETGLTAKSTDITFRLFRSGHDVQQIVQQRSLKQSTIHDHLLEIALIYDDFPYQLFLSPRDLDYIQNQAEETSVEIRRLKQQFPHLGFFETRLMQINHLRSGRKEQANG